MSRWSSDDVTTTNPDDCNHPPQDYTYHKASEIVAADLHKYFNVNWLITFQHPVHGKMYKVPFYPRGNRLFCRCPKICDMMQYGPEAATKGKDGDEAAKDS